MKITVHCYYDNYESYASMKDGLEACSTDVKCAAAYDQDCDGTGDVTLCESKDIAASSTGSCIYVPNGKFRKSNLQLCINIFKTLMMVHTIFVIQLWYNIFLQLD